MEYLIHFIKAVSLVELALIALAFVLSLLLVIIGIWICFKAKSRVTVFAFIAATSLPLLICLVAVGYRWYNDNLMYEANESRPGDAIYERFKRENQADYLITGILGLVSSAMPFLVGIAGLIVKRKA
jgi:hypothetical protein